MNEDHKHSSSNVHDFIINLELNVSLLEEKIKPELSLFWQLEIAKFYAKDM